jgi:Uma2 family endonuclease
MPMPTLTARAKPPIRLHVDPCSLRRFTVAEYHQMIEKGILGPDDRVELLEGWIFKKKQQHPPHSSSVSRVNRWLCKVLPNDCSLGCQAPVTLSESEPEPDFFIARGDEGTYDKRHPGPSDIGVLMEVGDSTVLEDRRYKGALYARERIAEFWLINVVDRKIEVYTRPRGGKYQKMVEHSENQTVPLMLDGVKIADNRVGELLAKT